VFSTTPLGVENKKTPDQWKEGFKVMVDVDIPFDEIASWYPKGMVPWLKRNHPDKWGELLSIEKELNQASFDLDEERTAELLTEYRDFVRSMVDEFESRKRGKGKHIS
jgi:hypothetical protein